MNKSSCVIFSVSDTYKKIFTPEIHINIWEIPSTGCQSIKKIINKKIFHELLNDRFNCVARIRSDIFIDFGLMFDINDDLPSEIQVNLPWTPEKNEIISLHENFKEDMAAAAIFNETFSRESTANHVKLSFIKKSSETPIYIGHLLPCTINKGSFSINLKEVVENIKKSHSKSFNQPEIASRCYIRFRILNCPRSLYSIDAQGGDWYLLSPKWQKNEDFDFRLNVERVITHEFLVKEELKLLTFSKVQLFLMRSRDKDLFFYDKKFQAARSLEDEEFWIKYANIPTKKAKKIIRNSIGYHWKESGSGTIQFSTLARFKVWRHGMLFYFIWILLIAIIGNYAYSKLTPHITSIEKYLFDPKKEDV